MRILLWFLTVILTFTAINVTAQNVKPFDYSAQWKKADNFMEKGRPQSALKIVNEIYAQSKKEKLPAQQIKAVIYKINISENTVEESNLTNLKMLEDEIRQSSFPLKPVLQSMLAEKFWNYYQNNRYEFMQRTQTQNFKNDDISTWSLNKIVEEVIQNYELSLSDTARLKKTDISMYNDILVKGNFKGRSYRPTLFDFLAHRALDMFMNDEPDLTHPAYSFTINSPDYLNDAESFGRLKLSSPDSMSYKYYALKILQDLINFHLEDPKPDALVDVDLKRLQFVYLHLTVPNKQQLYLDALKILEQKTKGFQSSAMVSLEIARLWRESGDEYKPLLSRNHKWDKKKAYDICENIIKTFPGSDAAAIAYNFEQEIKMKSVSAVTEKVNVPGVPFRTLVTYRNISSLSWRAVKVSRKEIADLNKQIKNYSDKRQEKFLEHFVAKTAVSSGIVTIPDDHDFQQHSTEIRIDALPEGDYLILLSANPNFALSGNEMNFAFTTVSNISYIHRNMTDGSTEFYVLNRTTGEPLQGASAQTFLRYYNASAGTYQNVPGDSFVSDSSGKLVIPLQISRINERSHDAYYFSLSWQGDSISTIPLDGGGYDFGQTLIYQPEPVKPAKKITKTFFFLDRAIYRPGQTIYFKGLLFSSDGRKPEILPNSKQKVVLYDVNHKEVASKEVVTNEFGSFNGTFTAPVAGLTGRMSIMIFDNSNSSAYFSVEEYKRPKFEVKVNPVSGMFRLGENIHVTGNALAYSGANIDGAKVSYRVVREAKYPWWWDWNGSSSPETEITNGNTQTSADGTFSIDFKAVPDETLDKKNNPTFIFHVYADVTDINGETHTGEATINVGYHSLKLGVDIKDVDTGKDTKKQFPITTTNLSGEFTPASGSIRIWKLKAPEKSFRQRYWTRPDTFTMSRDEYYKAFPFDLYADENNPTAWQKEKEVFTGTFNTSFSRTLLIPDLNQWAQGKYRLEISSKDTFGEDVNEMAMFDVLNTKNSSIAIPRVNYFKEVKMTAEPGENAEFVAGSSLKISVLYEIEHDGKIIEKHRLSLDNEKQVFTIPIKEEYRGNIAVHYTFVKDNRLYNQTFTIYVPYTNKELDIKFETFRDKLQPGQQEQWKIRISGNKADKITAEMVATMYDASLDAFQPHTWHASFYPSFFPALTWESRAEFEQESFLNYEKKWNDYKMKWFTEPIYDHIIWNYPYNQRVNGVLYFSSPVVTDEMALAAETKNVRIRGIKSLKSESLVEDTLAEDVPQQPKSEQIQIRRNFNETAFFFPHLLTDENGEILLSFTMPDALTRWKMLGFAHTKELQYGMITKELVTQKDLMIVPNQPRFFREGDKMTFSAKVTSLTDKDLTGETSLEFFDALTMKPINDLMKIQTIKKAFSIKARQSTSLEWNIEIPEGIQAITYRITARAENFSDAEEMALPVVTNRMLVTESMPISIRGNQTKIFRFEKLLNNNSQTLRNQRFTLEFTSNPAWYAVQALPYMMEYPYECTEQVFSRFYANSLASKIVNSNPKIKRVFDAWSSIQPDALLSNLEKNQELKSALLEETPWVLNAKSENERKHNIALLFDLNRMANEQQTALKKIREAQLSNGGFPWFKGLPEDRYITQHIIAGMGHLDAIGIKSVRSDNPTWTMVKNAIRYLDERIRIQYEELESEAKSGHLKLEENHLSYEDIHYLYMRSYFRDVDVFVQDKPALDYYVEQAKKYWLQKDIYAQGMVALALYRFGNKEIPDSILTSLNERALHSEEMGMYWKYQTGYYWYQAPIETQSLMIELYEEVAHDSVAVEELKVWLLKQKQTQDWKTTKATAAACYALLLKGTDILTNTEIPEITVGKEKIDPQKREDTKVEAGTGYFKIAWPASEVKPEMGDIVVSKKDAGVAWGAAYWQYFEQLDKITPASTPLSIKKQLFLQKNTDRGPVIIPVSENTVLHPGDLIKVRIEIRSDRVMEYIHLKDMRAAAFEPTETLSTYKYQDGLWYYQNTRDLSLNFFISWLPKGTHVFEYPLRVSQKGDFSNGVTTIQSMYAPEFSSHSEGIRVRTE